MNLFRTFAIALIASCSPAVIAAVNVADVVSRYSELRLGDARQVSNVSFPIGHLTIAMPSGVAAPVIGKDDTPVGVFYRGSGTFTYDSVYKDEFAVFRSNAKSTDVTIAAGPEKLTVREPFEDVIVFGEVPALSGEPATAPGDAFAKHVAVFGKEEAYPAGQLFALQAADAVTAKPARVQINGGRPWLYVHDDIVEHNESLSYLRKPGFISVQFKNSLFNTRLSAQPVGRKPREEPAPRVMLTDVDVALTASEKTAATMTVVETLVPQKRAAGALHFDFYSEYFVDEDRAPRVFRIKSITDGEGRTLSFNHFGNELVVGLATPAPAGQPLKLRFEVDGDFLYRPGGDNYWELGLEPWFPQPQGYEQAYTYHGVIKVKQPFVPYSPGKTLRRAVEGDYNVVETRLEHPVDGVAILAGKYHHTEETRNGLTVRVATYAVKNPAGVKKLTNLAFGIIDYYPRFLGPFPFEELNIIEKNDFGYGQAPAATVFITKEAFTPLQEEASEYSEGVNSRFAHEIAHQYWGNAIMIGSSEENWLSEAFADYSAALFMRDAKHVREYDTALTDWRAKAREAGEIASIPTAHRIVNPGFPQVAFMKWRQLLYFKGPYLLAALHKELGEQTFLTFLKSYQKSFRWKHGKTEDVIGLLNFMTKKDYAPFFEQYFYGTALPEVAKR